MPTNDERRDVAERLRMLSGHREVDKEFVHDALGLYMGECVDGYDPVSVSKLADLIEPTAERCDRDALLRLADYLDEDATLLCQRMIALPIRHWGGYEGPMAQQETWIAHQIRKACGFAVEEVCDGLEVTE